jgi:hypothetical protein
MSNRTGKAVRELNLGVEVNRAAADILTGAQVALFNVVGGDILLTGLRMINSVAAVDADANNTQFLTNPTVGADMPLCAVLNVISSAVGATFSITGLITDAMTGPVAGGGAMTQNRPVIVPVGTIDITSAADGNDGGARQAVDLWYIPLDDGAYVTAT